MYIKFLAEDLAYNKWHIINTAMKRASHCTVVVQNYCGERYFPISDEMGQKKIDMCYI